jgi:hypothetical protein
MFEPATEYSPALQPRQTAPSKNEPAGHDMKTGHTDIFCIAGTTTEQFCAVGTLLQFCAVGTTEQFCARGGHVAKPLVFDELQSRHPLRPMKGLYVFKGHRVHIDAFTDAENVPTGHAMHALPLPGE